MCMTRKTSNLKHQHYLNSKNFHHGYWFKFWSHSFDKSIQINNGHGTWIWTNLQCYLRSNANSRVNMTISLKLLCMMENLNHIQKEKTLGNYFDTNLDPICGTPVHWYELKKLAAKHTLSNIIYILQPRFTKLL